MYYNNNEMYIRIIGIIIVGRNTRITYKRYDYIIELNYYDNYVLYKFVMFCKG